MENREIIKTFEATLETRKKKDTDDTYTCVIIKLSPTYEKFVWLTKAEIELLKLN